MKSISIDVEHTRKVNNDDNYFIIKIKLKKEEYEIGVIQPSFNKEEFINEMLKTFKIKTSDIEIAEVISFKDSTDYYKYKKGL